MKSSKEAVEAILGPELVAKLTQDSIPNQALLIEAQDVLIDFISNTIRSAVTTQELLPEEKLSFLQTVGLAVLTYQHMIQENKEDETS